MRTHELTTNLGRIDAFFGAIGPWLPGYKSQTFGFFGVQAGNTIEICAAQVRLHALKKPRPPVGRAGRFAYGIVEVRRVAQGAQALVQALVNGTPIRLPDGRGLVLSASENANVIAVPHTELHAEGLAMGARLSVLEILGGMLELVQPQVDWELKAARTPYDGLNELLVAYQIRAPIGDRRRVSVVTQTAVEVLAESKISEGSAEIGLWVPAGLRASLARLNYRVIDRGKTAERGTLAGKRLSWSKRGPAKVGTARIPVPRGAVLNCVAVYAECAHHSTWIGDPKEFQNPRLASLETIDSNLETLKTYLLPTERKGAAARHFESAVSWLVWACGLSAAHLGYADLLKEGPDILAVAPSGAIAVVECTLGILKEDHKLAKVARRAISIRERLAASGYPNHQVLPVLVTALSRREVESELDSATDAGVLVVCRENLQSALQEVVTLPNGDQIFRRGWQMLEEARANLRRRRTLVASVPM